MNVDELTCHCSIFGTFSDLIEHSIRTGVSPRLCAQMEFTEDDRRYNFRRWELCEAFDDWMQSHGLPQRAYRGYGVQSTSWEAFNSDA